MHWFADIVRFIISYEFVHIKYLYVQWFVFTLEFSS